MTRSKGFALVLVLWVLSLMTVMAGSFALTMRRETGIVAGASNNAQALALAESGLALAEFMIMHPDQLQRWRTDGSIYEIDYPDSKIRIRLLSETGKIDINTADETLLQTLMLHAPIEAELQTKLVNAILDWRDNDDLIRIEGAEQKEYKQAGLSYQPRNKPFQTIEELQLVLGMNEQVYQWLENLVTVNSGRPQVDLAQAAKEVLYLLPGMDTELIDEYMAARQKSAADGLPPPAAPMASNLGNATPNPAVNANNPFAAAAAAAIAANNGMEQQAAMTVIAEAQLDDGTTAAINALIQKSNNPAEASPFQVLKWQRNIGIDDSLFIDETEELLVRRYAEPEFNN